MALQVWLPLNGDLRNNGLSNIIVTNNGAIINDAGKIGKCYQCDGSHYISFPSSPWMSMKPAYNFSLFLWVKGTTTGWLIAAGGWELLLRPTFARIGLSGNGQYPAIYNATFDTDTWYHLGFTWNGSTGALKLYLNGNEVVSSSVPSSANFDVNDTIKLTYDGPRYINDIRIYDHALSEKEVKEISKGLVCHYTLDSSFSTDILQYDKTIYTEPDGSQWIRIFHINNPNTRTTWFSKTADFDHGVYLDENAWIYCDPIFNIMTKFDLMIKQKTTSDATEYKYRWTQLINPAHATWEAIKPGSSNYTINTSSGYTDSGYGGLHRQPNNVNTRYCLANNSKGNWWGSIGSYEKYSSGIPGVGQVSTGYMDLYIKISEYPDNIVYDTSGYYNNGTVSGTLNVIVPSPRYKTCARFSSNATRLSASRSINVQNEYTLSCWFKLNGNIFQAKEVTLIGLYYGAGIGRTLINKQVNNTFFDLWMGGGAVNGTNYSSVQINSSTTVVANIWYHIVGSKDKNNRLHIYINGQEENTGTTVIAQYSGITSTPNVGPLTAGSQYDCDVTISDVRIYCTALSAADVKELYETSMIVNSDGTLSARSLTS